MITATRSTVVGVFPDRRLAAQAFTDLRHAGFQDCVDTELMFRRLLAQMQADRLLPPNA